MQDSRLLSTFQDESLSTLSWPASQPLDAARAQQMTGLDLCQPGVVLRALAGVQTVMAVVVLFETTELAEWLFRFSTLTAAALPATLFWIALCCTGRRWLGKVLRQPVWSEVVWPILVGLCAGLLACLILRLTGIAPQTPWLACAMSGAMLSGALVGLLVWRAKALEPSHSQARLMELQARIRPHFLFNTLNSAIALVREEPAKAEALLEDLSELFRAALGGLHEQASLAEELALAQHYLAIEKIRFGTRLRVEWKLDPQAMSAQLPRLILQPLVENAVKHGVEPSAEGADIQISTRRKKTHIVIKVTNSVPAGQGEQGSGMALDNVKERLRLMHDLECDFRHGMVDGYYQARIEVPA